MFQKKSFSIIIFFVTLRIITIKLLMNNPKSHFYFRNPIEGVQAYKQTTRFPGIKEEEEEKNYQPMREDFKRCLASFYREREDRMRRRNQLLVIPAHIEYIEIEFHSSFDRSKYEVSYLEQFGLILVRQDKFNTLVLFAIDNQTLFQKFIENVDLFIREGNPENRNILFIRKFAFYGSENIIKYANYNSYTVSLLTGNFNRKANSIMNALMEYLEGNQLDFTYDDTANKIEIWEDNENHILNIANNFDVVESITATATTLIRPSLVNALQREYGFEISGANEDLPIVGIIDTGISKQTPLAPLLVNEAKEFDITNTDPCIDEANHGTSVAFLTALGSKSYPNHKGTFDADCKLLSIKVMSTNSGFPSQTVIKNLIQEAHLKYAVKIFTLTIGFNENKTYNTLISEYAYTLDCLVYELDILICIAVGNNSNLFSGMDLVDYPTHFKESDRTLNSPSDSMNNISVGAISDNFEGNGKNCFSEDSYFPASYTLKSHLNWDDEDLKDRGVINIAKKNKHLVKPDIVYNGGDFDTKTEFETTGLTLLSAYFDEFWKKEVGTSFSTPLIANMAAKLLKKYPNLRYNMQTLKALIINSATIPNYGDVFKNENIAVESLVGKGIPNDDICLSSEDNCVTLVLEDSIKAEDLRAYTFKLPTYLSELDEKRSILEINATLCFKFKPIYFNFLSYCPIHIAFGFFKGTETIDSMNGKKTEEIQIKAGISWSEDYYGKAKLLSNCQKMSIRLSKNDLVNNNNQFKVAIHSKYHKLLNNAEKDADMEHPFSLVIRVEEVTKLKSGRLYEEIQLFPFGFKNHKSSIMS